MPKSIHRAPYQNLLKQFRGARLSAGLTQVALAARLKRPQAFISAVEAGITRLDFLQVWDWCVACETSILIFAKEFTEGMTTLAASTKLIERQKKGSEKATLPDRRKASVRSGAKASVPKVKRPPTKRTIRRAVNPK